MPNTDLKVSGQEVTAKLDLGTSSLRTPCGKHGVFSAETGPSIALSRWAKAAQLDESNAFA